MYNQSCVYIRMYNMYNQSSPDVAHEELRDGKTDLYIPVKFYGSTLVIPNYFYDQILPLLVFPIILLLYPLVWNLLV